MSTQKKIETGLGLLFLLAVLVTLALFVPAWVVVIDLSFFVAAVAYRAEGKDRG